MAFIADNLGFQIAVCEALGINPSATERITIVLEAQSITRVEVEQYLTTDSAETLKKVFELSSWIPVGTASEGQE